MANYKWQTDREYYLWSKIRWGLHRLLADPWRGLTQRNKDRLQVFIEDLEAVQSKSRFIKNEL